MTATDTTPRTSPIPTAPGALPLLGHALPLLRDPLAFLRSLPAHGDLVTIRLGTRPAVVVCDPGVVHEVLVNDHTYDKGGPFYDRVREFVGNGLASCPHDQHRRQRRLLQPAFHSTRLTGYAHHMTEQITAVTDTWHDGQVIDVYAEMTTITARTLIATLFGAAMDTADMDQATADVTVLLQRTFRRMLQPELLNRLPTPANHSYRGALRRLRQTIGALITDQRARSDADATLIPMILTNRDTAGDVLSHDEVIDQVVTFFIAGVETTASILAWALHFLAAQSDIQGELYSEVSSTLNGSAAALEHLPNLPLTRAIITETLRLYPPVWLITRNTTRDSTLAGFLIPADTTLIYSPYLIHHRPDLFAEPEQFNPRQWTDETAGHPARHTYIPFGAGARKCVGDQFGINVATLALAIIADRWHLQHPHRTSVRPLPRTTLRPVGLRVRTTKRS